MCNITTQGVGIESCPPILHTITECFLTYIATSSYSIHIGFRKKLPSPSFNQYKPPRRHFIHVDTVIRLSDEPAVLCQLKEHCLHVYNNAEECIHLDRNLWMGQSNYRWHPDTHRAKCDMPAVCIVESAAFGSSSCNKRDSMLMVFRE